MIKYLLLVMLSLGLLSCGDENLPIDGLVQPIYVPFQDPGYRNFFSHIIEDEVGLESFLESVSVQDYWSDKQGFLSSLLSESTDFTSQNLLLFRMTEVYSNIQLTPQFPESTEDGVLIPILRETPRNLDVGNADYLLVYRVHKSVPSIIMKVGGHHHVLVNKASTKVIPQNCLSWREGCTTCARFNAGIVRCNPNACSQQPSSTFYCQSWLSSF